jgi:hypothetical protein
MSDNADLVWLVEQRCDIQRLLLRLHQFGERKHFKKRAVQRATFEILIGVTFALWRTVFLLDTERSRRKVTSGGMSFLTILITDNAIAYNQERKTFEWSVGYYLNDAYLRLRLLNELRAAHSVPVSSEQSKPIDDYFSRLVKRLGVTKPLRSRWIDAFNVASLAFGDLETQAGKRIASQPSGYTRRATANGT